MPIYGYAPWFKVVRQFGRMCIRMVRFCRFADALRMLG